MNQTTGPGNTDHYDSDSLTERLARCSPRTVAALIDQGADPNDWVWADDHLQRTPLGLAIERIDNPCIQAMLEKLATRPDIPMVMRYDVAGDNSWAEETTVFDALVAFLSSEESLKGNHASALHNIKVFMMSRPIPDEWRIGIGEAFLKYASNKPLDVSGSRLDNLAYLLREASFPKPEGWNTVINKTENRGEFIDGLFNEDMLRETLVRMVDRAVAGGLHVDAFSGHYFHLDDYYPMSLLQMAVLHDDEDLVTRFVSLGADTSVRFPEDGRTREEWRGSDLVALAKLAERNTVLPLLEALKAKDVIMKTVAAAAKRSP